MSYRYINTHDWAWGLTPDMSAACPDQGPIISQVSACLSEGMLPGSAAALTAESNRVPACLSTCCCAAPVDNQHDLLLSAIAFSRLNVTDVFLGPACSPPTLLSHTLFHAQTSPSRWAPWPRAGTTAPVPAQKHASTAACTPWAFQSLSSSELVLELPAWQPQTLFWNSPSHQGCCAGVAHSLSRLPFSFRHPRPDRLGSLPEPERPQALWQWPHMACSCTACWCRQPSAACLQDWQEAQTPSWELQEYIFHQAAVRHPWDTRVPEMLFRGNLATGDCGCRGTRLPSLHRASASGGTATCCSAPGNWCCCSSRPNRRQLGREPGITCCCDNENVAPDVPCMGLNDPDCFAAHLCQYRQGWGAKADAG